MANKKNKLSKTTVHSMYWSNISQTILKSQRCVFESLGIDLLQELADGVSHGSWMDAKIESMPDDQIVVFCDIDAFPLTKQAFLDAIAFAQNGGVFGLAQTANHLPNKNLIYAGPMFMAFSKDTWQNLGAPSLKATPENDAAQLLTILARQYNIPISFKMPSACLNPLWALANTGLFGHGTFYGENEFFHLFESRKPHSDAIFSAIANDIINKKPLNFENYLQLQKNRKYSFIEKLANKIKRK